MKSARRRLCVVRLAMVVLLVVVGVPCLVLGTAASPAWATLGYPHASMQCVHAPYNTAGSGYWCPGYSWGTARDNDDYPSILSARGYAYRNCTDYVAWKVQSLGVANNKTSGLGHGGNWYDNAANKASLGLTRGTTPAVGAAAVKLTSATDEFGHVAYVESVNTNGTITVSEYNFNLDGNAHTRTGTAASMGFTRFVYFAPHMTNPPTGGGSGGNGTPPPLTGSSPIKNGSFNTDTSHWSVSGTANLVRNTSATGGGTNPYEGAGFAASNASQPGDSFSETNTASISSGDTYCVSAEVVTIGAGSGSFGTLALWLLGGGSDSSTYRYTNLPGSNNWQSIKTCVMATGNRTHIKVQFYPDPGSPTVGIDAVDVHQTLNASGGFNNGNGFWNFQPGTNFAIYTVASAVGTNPYEGSAFGATNTSQSGGSFTQDLPRSIASGDTFCAEAEVVTVGNTTGASGSLAVHLTGTTATESSVFYFNNLPGGNAWTNAKACVRAANPHSTIRVQVYPAVNGPTLGVDALDVHASIALNGGFNVDSSHWSPNGSLGYAQFQSFQGTLPYEGTGFEVVQTNQAGASLSEGRGWAWGVGDTYCAEAMVVTVGTTAGGGGVLALHLIGPGSTDTSTYSFSALPAGNGWTRAKTCVKANYGVSNGTIKVEIYPSTNNLPLGVDAVDVH